MNKIFGVGLSRSGTLSLTHAMSILGYKSCHFPEDMTLVEKFDFLCDTPIAAEYQKLDKQYPGSKFILTIRSLPEWLDSCKALWDSHFQDFTEYSSRIHLKLYGRLDYNEKDFAEAYENHILNTIYYFRQRKDLLVMNICAGDGWEKLCPFLGVKIPTTDFPNTNAREFLFKDGVWKREHEAKS